MSPELKQFYKELQNWIDSDFLEHPSFLRCLGICENFHAWGSEKKRGRKSLRTQKRATKKFYFSWAAPSLTFP